MLSLINLPCHVTTSQTTFVSLEKYYIFNSLLTAIQFIRLVRAVINFVAATDRADTITITTGPLVRTTVYGWKITF